MSDGPSKAPLAAPNNPGPRSPFARSSKLGSFVILAVMAICAGGGFALVQMSRSAASPPPTQWLLFAVGEIPPAAIVSHLEQPYHGAIVVDEHGIPLDTFLSPRDYTTWVSEQPLSNPVVEDAWAETETFIEPEIPTEEMPMALVIKGKLQAQQRIIFSIAGFQPENAYTLSFGDGYEQEVKRSTAYIYVKPGDYRVQLSMTSPFGQTKQRMRTLRIRSLQTQSSKAPREKESTLVIADFSEKLDEVFEEVEAIGADEEPRFIPSTGGFSNTAGPAVGPFEMDSLSFTDNRTSPAESGSRSETATDLERGEPYVMPEVVPSFPGGTAGMREFLDRQIVYPELATDMGIEGTVVVRFIVDRSGNLSDVTILKGIGYGCDREVKRVIRTMPPWLPGRIENQPVASYFVLPVKFVMRH